MATMRVDWVLMQMAIAGFVVWGCDGPSKPSSEQQVLSENRDLFRNRVGTGYDYDYQNVCFCDPVATRGVRVSVRAQARVSITSREDGAPIPRDRWNAFLTVEEIFDEMQQALSEGAASVRVSYDEQLGYPRDVFIDIDERIADEERGFTLDNLVPSVE